VRPVTYGGSVSGQVRDPLEWFRFGSPDPLSNSAMPDLGLGAVGFVRGRVLLGQTLPFSSYWPIGPGCQRTLLGAPRGPGILSPTNLKKVIILT
jgi:hypothetical protein